MNAIIETISHYFTAAEAWLAAQAAWATLFAWLAVPVAYLYRAALIKTYRKQLNQYDQLFERNENQIKKTNRERDKDKEALREMRIQLKQERQMKGEYRQIIDQKLKKVS